MSGHVRTDELLSLIRIIVPDAGTRLLSAISYKHYYVEFYYVGKIPRIRIGSLSLQQGVVLKWLFAAASEHLCRRYFCRRLYRVTYLYYL